MKNTILLFFMVLVISTLPFAYAHHDDPEFDDDLDHYLQNCAMGHLDKAFFVCIMTVKDHLDIHYDVIRDLEKTVESKNVIIRGLQNDLQEAHDYYDQFDERQDAFQEQIVDLESQNSMLLANLTKKDQVITALQHNIILLSNGTIAGTTQATPTYNATQVENLKSENFDLREEIAKLNEFIAEQNKLMLEVIETFFVAQQQQ